MIIGVKNERRQNLVHLKLGNLLGFFKRRVCTDNNYCFQRVLVRYTRIPLKLRFDVPSSQWVHGILNIEQAAI